jgi:hypothetical protein
MVHIPESRGNKYGTGPVLPVFLHKKFRHVAQNIKDKMCPIQDFTFRNYFEIFFSVVKGIIRHQNQNIIFFYKMMNLFNFPSSNKVLGLGRSIF